MAVRLRTDSVEDFLIEQAAELPRQPAVNPVGMCILPGQLIRQNLEEYLNHEGISIAPLAHFTTVEGLSSDLLAPTTEADQMLAGSVRDRLIEEILRSADPTNVETTDELDSETVLRHSEADALSELAKRLPYEDEGTREALIDELDDYYRWTDAATDVAPAVRELSSLDNQFAKLQSNRSILAFRGIERIIEGRLDDLSLRQHQSRSHLVRAARYAVDDQWADQFKHIDWVAVAGISVFDNPTIRFLTSIADHPVTPDVEVFLHRGSIHYNAARFEALPVESEIHRSVENDEGSFRSEAATELFRATTASPDEIPNSVTFLEAPTSQRVVERVAAEIRDLLRNGTQARDILVIAPNAGDYKSLIEHAFETVEIPVYVETRRPYANVPAYRFLWSFVGVIDSVAKDEPLTYGELVDPLRLGYCPRHRSSNAWPLAGRAFTKVEQELHRKQQYFNRKPDRYEDQGIPFTTWREIIEEIPDWTGPWWAVDTYLDDIEALVSSLPRTGDDLVDLFGGYLGTYVYQTVDHERALYEGPAVDTTRTSLCETHPTSQAELVRSRLDDVGSYYNQILDLFGVAPTWEEVARALSAALGGQSYGETHLDQHAIPVIDAGNAYFRKAKYIYLLGMDATEFPGEPPTSTFLHKELRRSVYKSATDGDTPYHHLDSRATGYGEVMDFYQAALSTANENAEITLCHTYRDERGNSIAWSPFVDLFDLKEDVALVDRPVKRVEVGDWLPRPQTESESWTDVADRVAPRERLRMLLYQGHRDHPEMEPAISRSQLATLYRYLPERPLEQLVLPRLDRYHNPPTAVEVAADEPAFDEVSLAEVTGGPHHPHELDLQGQCGLKYYYYQFLYNYTGKSPEREEIPKYYSSSPHWRLGQLPYIIRENYADPRYVEKWKQIIRDLLPERQSRTNGIAQFESDQELEEWVVQHELFDDYDMNTIYRNLAGERYLVERELRVGVERDWGWREGGVVDIGSDQLGVPAYRVDTVTEGDSAYRVPIFFTRFSNRATSALKTCFNGDNENIWEVKERTNSICLSCTKRNDCFYHSKYVVDHRMLAGCRHEEGLGDSSVVGVGLQEQFAGPEDGQRIIVIRSGCANKFHPGDGFEKGLFESLALRGYKSDWQTKLETWEENLAELASSVDSGESITFEANPNIVVTDECLSCVYRELCAVPEREVITE